MQELENHPLEPFLPKEGRLLLLGSFPPKRERWSMDFFYPNFINDMWRIIGLLFFGEKGHFITADGRHFDREQIAGFCSEKGIALYDTATQVRRLQDNASDKFLEVVTPTDLRALLARMPMCCAIATTGQKAAGIVAETFGCREPEMGGVTEFAYGDSAGNVRRIRFYRMPSTSRAYPMPIGKKAEHYRKMFVRENILQENQ